MPYPLSTRRGNQGLAEPIPGKSLPRWPCLLPSIVVGVVPLRNLTGEADKQGLVEGFTDRLVTDLFRQCRGVSFAWVADERRYADNLPPRNPPELSLVAVLSWIQERRLSLVVPRGLIRSRGNVVQPNVGNNLPLPH